MIVGFSVENGLIIPGINLVIFEACFRVFKILTYTCMSGTRHEAQKGGFIFFLSTDLFILLRTTTGYKVNR